MILTGRFRPFNFSSACRAGFLFVSSLLRAHPIPHRLRKAAALKAVLPWLYFTFPG